MDRAGAVTFSDQAQAERYLRALPEGYNGRVFKTESGRWMCSYRLTGGAVPVDQKGSS